MRPDIYCETVGFDTPIAFVIFVFDLSESSISLLRFSDISTSKLFTIRQNLIKYLIIRYCLIYYKDGGFPNA
jgi:hypothetical protein